MNGNRWRERAAGGGVCPRPCACLGRSGVVAAILLAASLMPETSPAQDSTFFLVTDDVARSPSPFIGNGRVGLVIAPLGLAAQPSLVAGLYEHGPGDVPRIVSAPAWNGIEVFDGDRPLDSGATVESYRQTLDLRTGTARTAYDWLHDGRRLGVRVETFVSRSSPDLAAVRLQLTPRHSGRVRVRFALAGWPPPRRLTLATAERAPPSWRPADIWYPGHAVVRDRSATAGGRRAELALSSAPEGRGITLAQASTVAWPRGLPHAVARGRAAGDTALV
ncbi:MAG TPA: hypothetical protein VM347_00740, partial [Nonomuraea sp.]|nr:hypothetical protein [Nonomuraea sp.]